MASASLYDSTLRRLRRICLSWPETSEVASWGHPNFRAGRKTFAVLEVYKGQLSLCFLPTAETHRRLAADARFYPTPYLAQRGWLSLKVAGKLDWGEIEDWLLESYRQVALQRMLKALEATRGTRRAKLAKPRRKA